MIGGSSKLLVYSSDFDRKLFPVILAILAGPSITGLVLAGLLGEYRELKSELTRKIHPRWYMIVLLSAPILMVVIYSLLSLLSQVFTPALFATKSKFGILIPGLVTGLLAGVFDEIGWTGFAIPRILKRNSIFKTGLIVGTIWAFWHILPGIWLGYASGTIKNTLSLISYVSDPFFFLVIYRILMVWVYDKTRSLSLALVMHGTLTASARIFGPVGIVGAPLLIFDFVWLFVMIIITVFVYIIRQKSVIKQ